MFLIYILCLVCLNIIRINSQHNINDTCVIQNTKQSGKCLLLQHCKDGFEDYKKGKLPQLCGYRNLEPIVCCKLTDGKEITLDLNTKREDTLISVKNNPNIETKMENMHEQGHENKTVEKKVGKIAEQKCLEYQQAVFDKSSYPLFPLTNKSAVLRVSKCPIDNHILSPKYDIAREREFPHMALIGYDDLEENRTLWYCGGTLISDKFVLTAAHCTTSPIYGFVKYVRLGELIISQMNESDSKDFTISKIIRHPEYKSPIKYNDIALLKLNESVTFSQYIRPACLNVNREIHSHRLIATGWGLKGVGGESSDTMKKSIQLPFTYEECSYVYRSAIGRTLPQGIIDSHLCAGLIYDKKDLCQGDSGGPLLILHPKIYCMYSIIGITSFGKGCGIAGIPGIFTRVSSYIKWIEDIVWS